MVKIQGSASTGEGKTQVRIKVHKTDRLRDNLMDNANGQSMSIFLNSVMFTAKDLHKFLKCSFKTS